MLQDMHELLQQKDGAKVAEVNEAVAEVSKKFELEAYHLRRSAAKVRFDHNPPVPICLALFCIAQNLLSLPLCGARSTAGPAEYGCF